MQSMIPRRTDSVGTVIGLVVFAIAVVGTVAFDWSWANPEGYLLPAALGVGAAVVAIALLIRSR